MVRLTKEQILSSCYNPSLMGALGIPLSLGEDLIFTYEVYIFKLEDLSTDLSAIVNKTFFDAGEGILDIEHLTTRHKSYVDLILHVKRILIGILNQVKKMGDNGIVILVYQKSPLSRRGVPHFSERMMFYNLFTLIRKENKVKLISFYNLLSLKLMKTSTDKLQHVYQINKRGVSLSSSVEPFLLNIRPGSPLYNTLKQLSWFESMRNRIKEKYEIEEREMKEVLAFPSRELHPVLQQNKVLNDPRNFIQMIPPSIRENIGEGLFIVLYDKIAGNIRNTLDALYLRELIEDTVDIERFVEEEMEDVVYRYVQHEDLSYYEEVYAEDPDYVRDALTASLEREMEKIVDKLISYIEEMVERGEIINENFLREVITEEFQEYIEIHVDLHESPNNLDVVLNEISVYYNEHSQGLMRFYFNMMKTIYHSTNIENILQDLLDAYVDAHFNRVRNELVADIKDYIMGEKLLSRVLDGLIYDHVYGSDFLKDVVNEIIDEYIRG